MKKVTQILWVCPICDFVSTREVKECPVCADNQSYSVINCAVVEDSE